MFLVPQARFEFASAEGQQIATERRAVLAIELRPYVDDGKQWVLYTDGTCQREAIRQDLVTAHGLQIRPVFKPSDLEAGHRPRSCPIFWWPFAAMPRRKQKPSTSSYGTRSAGSSKHIAGIPRMREMPGGAGGAGRCPCRSLAAQPAHGTRPVLRSWLALGSGAEPAEAARTSAG